jgi:hypothetical protein
MKSSCALQCVFVLSETLVLINSIVAEGAHEDFFIWNWTNLLRKISANWNVPDFLWLVIGDSIFLWLVHTAKDVFYLTSDWSLDIETLRIFAYRRYKDNLYSPCAPKWHFLVFLVRIFDSSCAPTPFLLTAIMKLAVRRFVCALCVAWWVMGYVHDSVPLETSITWLVQASEFLLALLVPFL